MERRVYRYIKEHQLIAEGESVLLGVSGGADSMCLLYLLNQLKMQLHCSIHVIHVNHMLRGETADRDADFVEKICMRLEVPFYLEKVDVSALSKSEGLSEEEAGRQARYEIFGRYQQKLGIDKIAVAHHLNDQSETVLFHLFRGTGIHGLTGIPVQRGSVIRPLLCCGRLEIENYLAEHKIPYCNDETNQDVKYTRNKIRRELLPYIRENINAQAEYHIASAAGRLRELAEYFDMQIEEAYARYVQDAKLLEKGFSLHPALCKGLIRKLIQVQAGKLKDITETHIEAVYGLTNNQTSKSTDLPYGLEAVRTYDGIEIRHKAKSQSEALMLEVMRGKTIIPNEYVAISLEKNTMDSDNIPERMYTKWFDCDKIDKLNIRTRLSGDYLIIDDKGTRKKLKEYLIEEKIPKEERGKLLLLAEGSHVLWVIGHRISSAYKVKSTTKQVIRVDYLKR